MAKKSSSATSTVGKRKATPEEVARYNEMLNREKSRMTLYRDLGISFRINVEGNYSTTAKSE